jgi:hypothetical protein
MVDAPSGHIPANSPAARCSLTSVAVNALPASRMMRSSTVAMIAPTMQRRALTARSTTAERESPSMEITNGGAFATVSLSIASRMARCSSGPSESSPFHSSSPRPSCNDTAWTRAGSKASRTLRQTAARSASESSGLPRGVPCSILLLAVGGALRVPDGAAC